MTPIATPVHDAFIRAQQTRMEADRAVRFAETALAAARTSLEKALETEALLRPLAGAEWEANHHS